MELYPFDVQCESIRGVKMSFLDEFTGTQPRGTLLFVHGNPTWSFHWRELVNSLRDTYRCIAVDHLGCGFSELPSQPLRLADRIENLVTLIDILRLEDVTLVVQDWGGAIGLGAVLERKPVFSRIVLFNTGAFRPWFIPWRIRICRTPVLGRLAVQGANLFCRAALSMTVSRKARLEPQVAAGYLTWPSTWESRRPVYDFVADIPGSPRHPTWTVLQATEERLGELADLPILLIWGMKDWCFTPACLDKFCDFWPRAEVHRLDDVGHWVMEDAPDQAREIVEAFLLATDASRNLPQDEGASPAVCTGPSAASSSGDRRPRDVPAGDHSAPAAALAAHLACALEATAPKPGNVHPGHAFVDLTYNQMLRSSAAIASVLQEARTIGVGRTVLRAVQAMHDASQTNAHLGTILLLAPLACIEDGRSHRGCIREILARLDAEDTRYVYEAIRLAQPGGLGDSAEADVREEAPRRPLPDVMRIAADRDLVARQFVTGFQTVFNEVATTLMLLLERGWDVLDAIVYAHVNLIARHGDSLIERKCGPGVSNEARDRAATCLARMGSRPFASREVQSELAGLDAWLRGDGNRRNPGTTADLLAAGLFVLLREERLPLRAAEDAVTSATRGQTA